MPGDPYVPFIPRIEDALGRYFRLHGEPLPTPARLACLARFVAWQIDRRNYGFKSTTYDGMASFVVPAYLYPGHREHATIAGFVALCAGQGPAVAGTEGVASTAKAQLKSFRLAKDVGRLDQLKAKRTPKKPAARRSPR